MSSNSLVHDGNGAVRDRGQTQNPAGNWVERGTETGHWMDVKTTVNTPFKGVTKERKWP